MQGSWHPWNGRDSAKNKARWDGWMKPWPPLSHHPAAWNSGIAYPLSGLETVIVTVRVTENGYNWRDITMIVVSPGTEIFNVEVQLRLWREWTLVTRGIAVETTPLQNDCPRVPFLRFHLWRTELHLGTRHEDVKYSAHGEGLAKYKFMLKSHLDSHNNRGWLSDFIWTETPWTPANSLSTVQYGIVRFWQR